MNNTKRAEFQTALKIVLSRDPQATRNVAAQHPQVTADFRPRIDAWRREIQQPQPLE